MHKNRSQNKSDNEGNEKNKQNRNNYANTVNNGWQSVEEKYEDNARHNSTSCTVHTAQIIVLP